MPAPPRRLKDLIEGTVDHHASLTHPDLQEVTIRWRGSFGCLIAWAGEGDQDDEVEAAVVTQREHRGCDAGTGRPDVFKAQRRGHPGEIDRNG